VFILTAKSRVAYLLYTKLKGQQKVWPSDEITGHEEKQ
jgi:hypothetical protein